MHGSPHWRPGAALEGSRYGDSGKPVELRPGTGEVVDPGGADRGVAVIGSTVLVDDLDSGKAIRYRLASAHHSLGPDAISAASPMGRALVGATPGTTVTVDLPNGRSRRVRLVEVATGAAAGPLSRTAA